MFHRIKISPNFMGKPWKCESCGIYITCSSPSIHDFWNPRYWVIELLKAEFIWCISLHLSCDMGYTARIIGQQKTSFEVYFTPRFRNPVEIPHAAAMFRYDDWWRCSTRSPSAPSASSSRARWKRFAARRKPSPKPRFHHVWSLSTVAAAVERSIHARASKIALWRSVLASWLSKSFLKRLSLSSKRAPCSSLLNLSCASLHITLR